MKGRDRFWCLVAIVLIGSCYATEEPGADRPAVASSEKEGPVLTVVADSPSAMLRATHILHVRVAEARVGEWTPVPDVGGVRREVVLVLKLEESLKGTTRQRPGDSIRLTIFQYGTGSSRIAAVPGVWSHARLEEGADLVTFSSSGSDDAVEILQEPSCERVLEASDALADVRVAVEAEKRGLALPELLGLAGADAPSLRDTFTDYVWARWEKSALSEKQAFERLMEFVEAPELGSVARATLVNSIDAEVSVSDTVSDWHVHRHAIMMFRLLCLDRASGLHDEIIEVFLPNLLRLDESERTRTADEVFRDDPSELPKARRCLEAYQGDAPAARLLAWLQ